MFVECDLARQLKCLLNCVPGQPEMHVVEFQAIAVGIKRGELCCLVAAALCIGLQELVIGEGADLVVETAVICCDLERFVTQLTPDEWRKPGPC